VTPLLNPSDDSKLSEGSKNKKKHRKMTSSNSNSNKDAPFAGGPPRNGAGNGGGGSGGSFSANAGGARPYSIQHGRFKLSWSDDPTGGHWVEKALGHISTAKKRRQQAVFGGNTRCKSCVFCFGPVAIRGTVMCAALPPAIFASCLAVAAFYYFQINPVFGQRMADVHQMIVIITTALGFLLVFRTNDAYHRYYEGRKLLGKILRSSQNIILLCCAQHSAEASMRFGDGRSHRTELSVINITRLINVLFGLIRQGVRESRMAPPAHVIAGKSNPMCPCCFPSTTAKAGGRPSRRTKLMYGKGTPNFAEDPTGTPPLLMLMTPSEAKYLSNYSPGFRPGLVVSEIMALVTRSHKGMGMHRLDRLESAISNPDPAEGAEGGEKPGAGAAVGNFVESMGSKSAMHARLGMGGRSPGQLSTSQRHDNNMEQLEFGQLIALKQLSSDTSRFTMAVFEELKKILDASAGCGRIVDTPTPFSYQHLISIGILIITVGMPLVFASRKASGAFIAALISFCVTFTFNGIFALATEIENPFGYDDNDYDLAKWGRKVLKFTLAHASFAGHMSSSQSHLLRTHDMRSTIWDNGVEVGMADDDDDQG
jgi:predicted membrane chloride channel (bestrophin family)